MDNLTESERVKLIEFQKQLDLAETHILIFIAIFTVLGNTMVLVATWRERILHQPNKYFIACLAVADLLVAFATYAATPHSGSWGILLTRSNLCPYDDTKEKGFYTFLAVSALFLPSVVILVMYALIYVVVHKRQQMLRNGELSQTRNDQNQRSAFLQDLK
ncbi:dopamine D2-like receptor, partial, partial [Paramuricea clavata]